MWLFLCCVLLVIQKHPFCDARNRGFITDPSTRGMFEGDMDLNGNNLMAYLKPLDNNNGVSVLRAAIRNPYLRWPNGVVYYSISSGFKKRDHRTIKKALLYFQKKTKCIQFKKRNHQKDYVHIRQGMPGECSSKVGKVGGRQEIKLSRACLYRGMIVHELMHALGFFHEQSRPDRDRYVNVFWENIQRGQKTQFRSYTTLVLDQLGLPYDYDSIMHYGSHAFSRNLRPTIYRKNPGPKIGQRKKLSRLDIQKVNKLYDSCKKAKKPEPEKKNQQTRSECKVFPRYFYVCQMLAGYGYCSARSLSRVMTTVCCSSCRSVGK